MEKFKQYLKAQNIEFTFQRIVIQGFGGMAQGLFASLLIGTIIKTIGLFLPGPYQDFFLSVSEMTFNAQGAAMAVAIGYSMQASPYIIFSLATVGLATNMLGGGAGPLAIYVISLIAILAGKLVSKKTPIDIIVTPLVTILIGVFFANLLAPPIASLASQLGNIIIWATRLQPFWMGMMNSLVMGIILSLPISSAAMSASLGLVGLAGGAALAGCCAHMVGFAICSYKDNGYKGLVSVGIGTSMLLFPNLVKKPILWLPPVLASLITGPVATVIFKLEQNGTPITSGMGTCGLVGPIGLISGWISPSQRAVELGLKVAGLGFYQWVSMLLICFILPAIISYICLEVMRKKGWVKEGDYLLP